jgi:hypothetical protein
MAVPAAAEAAVVQAPALNPKQRAGQALSALLVAAEAELVAAGRAAPAVPEAARRSASMSS